MDYKHLLDAKSNITGHNSNTSRYLDETRRLREQLTDLRDRLTRDIEELQQAEAVLTKLNRVQNVIQNVAFSGTNGTTLGETGFNLDQLERDLEGVEHPKVEPVPAN